MSRPLGLIDLDRLLAHGERAIALLDRCLPTNGALELQRLAARWTAIGPEEPGFAYRARPDLSELLRALDWAIREAPAACTLGSLYAARAVELCREAAIVGALGTPEFRELASRRFAIDESAHGRAGDAEAAAWASLPVAPGGTRILADDEGDPRSLVNVVRAALGTLRLPVRVVLSRELTSSAATGDGIIVVRAGLSHREQAARRIAHHEVYGHALPRVRARAEPLGLFAVGTSGAADDEEGRALLIEMRTGLFDDERRKELGLRHLGALAVRRGADFVEVVRLVQGYDVPLRPALALASRVARGGGLARELVYLPALHRVRAAFEADPDAETWCERGRISLAAIPSLREAYASQASSESNRAQVSSARHSSHFRQRNVATTGA